MSKYTLTPKAGDTVRVRLHDGRAVDAEYVFHFDGTKIHSVDIGSQPYFATREAPAPKMVMDFVSNIRFIYPLSLMPKPEVRE